MEAARDHQVQDEEEVVVARLGSKDEDDSLADSPEGVDRFAFDRLDAGNGGAEEEWRGYAEVFERLAQHSWGKGGEVGRDVGELGHVNKRKERVLMQTS
jgi:hypothetical protein